MAQLIFIDGIPGSGKTTTARWLAEALRTQGRAANLWPEWADPHPLNGWWTWDDGYTPPDRVEAPFDAGRFTGRIIENCDRLVSEMAASGETCVIEAYPFQLAAKIHLKMGASERQIHEYFAALQDAVGSTGPILFFLDPPDREEAFRRTCQERGADSEEWLIGQVTRSPYGRRRGLVGWRGMMGFYRDYDCLVRRLLSTWRYRLRSYAPGVQDWNWIRAGMMQRINSVH